MSDNQTARIAFFLPTLQGGGAERVAVTLVNEFAKRGLPTDLLVADASGPYLKSVDSAVRVIDFRASRVLASLPGLVRYIRRERPLAIVSVMKHANVAAFLAARISSIDPVLIVSEHSMLFTAASGGGLKGVIIRKLMQYAYPRCHGIVAVSSDVGDGLARQLAVPRSRVNIIYNPIFNSELIEKSFEPVPDLAGIGHPIILAVGRLVDHKDYSTLLRAFADLRRKSTAKLVILGEGHCKAQLQQLINELGLNEDVLLAGFVENPFAWMRNADVFALSSSSEGFGNVLVEAMACGTRVVSTDCPGGPKEILENGLWGRLVPVGDYQALAAALIEAIEDPSPPPVTVRASEFSVDRAVDGYLKLIYQLANVE